MSGEHRPGGPTRKVGESSAPTRPKTRGQLADNSRTRDVECFLIRPTGNALRLLRVHVPGPQGWERLDDADDRSGWCDERYPWHDAVAVAGEVPAPALTEEGHYKPDQPIRRRRGDPPWPTECDRCGASLARGGRRVLHEMLYTDVDGNRYLINPYGLDALKPPPGAMWDAPWYPWKGPDGLSLVVMLPDGMPWAIDGPATGGGHWTREGEPPAITVNPSIQSGKAGEPGSYHGWLRRGVLSPA